MANWKLNTPHYLNLVKDGPEWEYKEVDRTTGRQKSKKFRVPALLDPADPSAWTERFGSDDGIIVVSDGVNPARAAYIFEGEPTPDMLPMDDEARAISAKLASKWNHPIDGLDRPYGEAIADQFRQELAEAQATPTTTKIEGMDLLLSAMTQMMQQNQALLSTLVPAQPAASAGRRQ